MYIYPLGHLLRQGGGILKAELAQPEWYDAQKYLAAKHETVLMRHRILRHDVAGDPGMNVGHWVYIVIAAMVLVIVVAALFGPLTTALTNYADNETTFGPILQTLVPILIGVGILLAFVVTFLPRAKKF